MLTSPEGHESATANVQEPQNLSEYLKIEDISAYLNIKSKTLYAMVESGNIPHYRIGRLIRFKREDVDSWMKAKKVIGSDRSGKFRRATRPGKPNQYIDGVIRRTIDGLKA